MTIQKLDRALRHCFKRAANRNGCVRLPKIGWVRVHGLSLPDRIDLGNKPVTVIQKADRWHIAVPFAAPLNDYGIPPKPIVGINEQQVNGALLRFVLRRRRPSVSVV